MAKGEDAAPAAGNVKFQVGRDAASGEFLPVVEAQRRKDTATVETMVRPRRAARRRSQMSPRLPENPAAWIVAFVEYLSTREERLEIGGRCDGEPARRAAEEFIAAEGLGSPMWTKRER